MNIFWGIYFSILIIGITAGIFRLKKLNESSQKALIYLILVFIFECGSLILKIYNDNNLWIYHISTPSFLIIYFWIFKSEFRGFVSVFYFSIIIISISVFSGIYNQKIGEVFPSDLYIICSLITIILCLIYFFQILNYKSNLKLSNLPLFWISCGLLFFHTINILGYGAFSFINNRNNLIVGEVFSWLRTISNYLLYSIFIFAFLGKQNSLKIAK
jgi:hypothetical protein